jgi:molybdopterin/thiamine biosynthesis adenylyltransferase
MDVDLARYARQMLFPPLGAAGQRRLLGSRVTLVGCGALGSALANTLVRAGVGHLRIVDRDFLELDNLHRQVLFDEPDLAEDLPKAEAAARKLRRINSTVEIEPVVADFNPESAARLCHDADLILDGTDNLETRFLINDVAVKLARPWVFGACLAAEGLVLAIRPRQTPCLRCIWDAPPAPGTLPTCETAGVLGPLVHVVAGLQATEALKLLLGRTDQLYGALLAVDVWSGRLRRINVQPAYDEGDCPCCKRGQLDYLTGRQVSTTTTLCGRGAVQVFPAAAGTVDLRALASRLSGVGRVHLSDYLLRLSLDEYSVTLFPDGRAIIQGTSDPAVAKSIYARYIGL